MVRAGSAPCYVARLQPDVRSRVDVEAVRVATHEALAVARTLVVDTTLVGGLFLQRERHLVEVDVVYLFGCVAAYKRPVFARTADIMEVDVAHLAACAFCRSFRETPAGILVVAYGAGVGGDVNGFSLSPPHVGEEAAIYYHVRERHVGHRTLVAVLDADAPVAVLDDAVGEEHAADAVHVFRPYLDGARARGHCAVAHHYILAGAVLLEFAAVLQADAVVARLDETVRDAHVFRMVHVDAVAVADFQVVQDADAVYRSVTAADEMYGPVGAVADGHVADDQLLDIRQCQHVRARVEVGHGLQFVRVFQFLAHECHAVAVDGSRSGDGDILQVFSANPHHAFAPVLAKCTLGIDALVRVRQQARIGFKMQVDIRGEPEGAAQEGMSGRDEHRAASCLRAGVNGALQGWGIVGGAIARGSVVQDVVHIGLLRLARTEEADAQHEKQQSVCLKDSSHIKIGF